MEEKDLQQIGELIKQQMGVFTEDIQHKLDLVVEGQAGITERMDKLENRMDGLYDRTTRIELKVTALDHKVDRLDQKLDKVSDHLTEHILDPDAHKAGYRVMERDDQ